MIVCFYTMAGRSGFCGRDKLLERAGLSGEFSNMLDLIGEDETVELHGLMVTRKGDSHPVRHASSRVKSLVKWAQFDVDENAVRSSLIGEVKKWTADCDCGEMLSMIEFVSGNNRAIQVMKETTI